MLQKCNISLKGFSQKLDLTIRNQKYKIRNQIRLSEIIESDQEKVGLLSEITLGIRNQKKLSEN